MYYLLLIFCLFVFSCDSDSSSPECEGVVDCSGQCDGTAVIDECGECNGPGLINGLCDCEGNYSDDCGVCNGDTFFTNNSGFTGSFLSNSSYIRDCSDGSELGYIVTDFNCPEGNYEVWGNCVCEVLFPNECSNNLCIVNSTCDSSGSPIGDYQGNCCDVSVYNWNSFECTIPFVEGDICDCNSNIFDVCGVCGGNGSTCIGCTDDTACNYDSNVYIDDASCTYIDGICETCESGVIVDNDADDDTVCDDDEVLGCTDSSACNFSNIATDDDGTCIPPNECSLCDACDLPTPSIRLNDDGSLWYNVNYSVYGLQFDVEGDNLSFDESEDITINNNVLSENINIYTHNDGNRIRFVIFDLTGNPLFGSGCNELLQISLEGNYILNDVLVSGSNGSTLNITTYECSE